MKAQEGVVGSKNDQFLHFVTSYFITGYNRMYEEYAGLGIPSICMSPFGFLNFLVELFKSMTEFSNHQRAIVLHVHHKEKKTNHRSPGKFKSYGM